MAGTVTWFKVPIIGMPGFPTCPMPVTEDGRLLDADGEPLPIEQRTRECGGDAIWLAGELPICREHFPHPLGSLEQKAQLADALDTKRRRQLQSAFHFLTTGEQDGTPPPYGSEWDRTYNPLPDEWCEPDPEMFDGTEIGYFYGFHGSSHHHWKLPGWDLVRTGSEQRSKRKGRR